MHDSAAKQGAVTAGRRCLHFGSPQYNMSPQSMSKVKANDKFRFPLELDLSAYLPPEAQHGAVYDLSAILIHKGSSASHGHYGVKPDAEALPRLHPAVIIACCLRCTCYASIPRQGEVDDQMHSHLVDSAHRLKQRVPTLAQKVGSSMQTHFVPIGSRV